MKSQPVVSSRVRVFTVPTEAPEGDGTLAWNSVTMVLVEIEACGQHGLGYTYADVATGKLVEVLLKNAVNGSDLFAHAATRQLLLHQVRNMGECAMSHMAIAAIDNALWDLRARVLDVPLVSLLGSMRESIPVYGSGGFTTYDDAQLTDQLSGWAREGFSMVKIKVGLHPADDLRRVALSRAAVGPEVQLFVDANGAYTVTQALRLAHLFNQHDVRWFEEPVSSDDLTGLDQVRQRAPIGMDIAAGEYGYTAWYFRRMIAASAVTVLQVDATRCGGMSGFLEIAALCWAAQLPLSSHCGPSLHLHVCCAVPRAIHMEFFHTHARVERLFFDGFREPCNGLMTPDRSRPGLGLTIKEHDIVQYSL